MADQPDGKRERVTLRQMIAALFDHLCWEPRNPRCMIGEHDETEVREGREMFLRCIDCGRRSPGWTVDGAPVLKFAGDPERHKVTAIPPAVSTRLKVEVFESMEALAAALRQAEGDDDDDEFTTVH